MSQLRWQALVLDLGDVVFDWSDVPLAQVGARLRTIMGTDIYALYETGEIPNEATFCHQVGEQIGLEGSLVQSIFQIARQSLRVNGVLVDFVRGLKSSTGIRVYVMSNISNNDIDHLYRLHPSTMNIFDQVFTSGHAGLRKPDPRFFAKVIEDGQLMPGRTIFVDDKTANVAAAQTMGLYGVHFVGTDAMIDSLKALLLPKV
jgi:HAD superfamily hydrolase (TIGR01509 family)